MLTEKILFQNRDLAFYYPPRCNTSLAKDHIFSGFSFVQPSLSGNECLYDLGQHVARMYSSSSLLLLVACYYQMLLLMQLMLQECILNQPSQIGLAQIYKIEKVLRRESRLCTFQPLACFAHLMIPNDPAEKRLRTFQPSSGWAHLMISS